MNLYHLFTEQELKQQIEDGMVYIRTHASEPLSIINYTKSAPYDMEKWNHVTSICRGLIYNHETMEVVARPMGKFWNLGHLGHPETNIENLPAGLPELSEKLDGSMGILYPTKDGVAIATRGSFISEQAVWASKRAQELNIQYDPNYSFIYEIIYPDNRIVVKYDYADIVLLTAIEVETGWELPSDLRESLASTQKVRCVKSFTGDLSHVLDLDKENEEGYVAIWNSNAGPPFRVKIKFETYCRLHKLITGMNAKTIWEFLSTGRKADLPKAKDVPKEFNDWLRAGVKSLEKQYTEILLVSTRIFWQFMTPYYEEGKVPDRKEMAQFFSSQQPYTSILFSLADGYDPTSLIWKMIEPVGNSKTFKQEEE